MDLEPTNHPHLKAPKPSKPDMKEKKTAGHDGNEGETPHTMSGSCGNNLPVQLSHPPFLLLGRLVRQHVYRVFVRRVDVRLGRLHGHVDGIRPLFVREKV